MPRVSSTSVGRFSLADAGAAAAVAVAEEAEDELQLLLLLLLVDDTAARHLAPLALLLGALEFELDEAPLCPPCAQRARAICRMCHA